MIELIVTMTGKGFGRADKWQVMGEDRHSFADMDTARAWLKDHYGKSKRTAMYRDGPDGKATQTGYVIGYRNADWSHAPVSKWLQQDWIEFRSCNTMDLLECRA